MKRGHRIAETKNNDRIYPDRYWIYGLHDAQILSVEELELPYDHKSRDHKRNVFIIRVDSNHALFDRSVKEIRLYDYKILTGEISPSDLQEIWWISDSLISENDKYRLNISLKGIGKHSIYDFDFSVQFSSAEVVMDKSYLQKNNGK